VIVRGGGFAWAEDVRSSTEILYPDSAPQLKPGVDYKLIVETGDRNSYEPGFDLGFSILDPKDRERVQQEGKQIENLGLPDGPTQFLMAHLYASYGLRAEAIEKLESVSLKFKAAAIAALLGDLYASSGLIRNYLSAVELAKNENDEIGSMLAHLALARIYQQELGNAKAAIAHFDSALALANRLGDNSTAAEAGEKLAELRKTGTR
jgi:tetratricopeptide (TPR) repeat protein